MAEHHLPRLYAFKSGAQKGMNQNELTYLWGPEKMINVTEAGEIRGIMRCLNAPYPAGCGAQMTQGASRPQDARRCSPAPPISAAHTASLGSGNTLPPSAKIISGRDVLQKHHLSA